MQPQPASQNQGLGNLKMAYGPNRANARMILYVLPIFVLVGFILIGPIPVGGISMFVVAAGLLWGYWAQLRARAGVYEEGVALTDWLGHQQSFRWGEVTAVYEFIGYRDRFWTPNQWGYTVHTADGRQIKLDMGFEKVQNLGFMVLKETGKTFLPQYLERYRSGNPVTVGNDVILSTQGFGAGGDVLAWDQTSKVEITKRGDLLIHKREQRAVWKIVMHSKIANYPTFRAFLHEISSGSLVQGLIDDPQYQGSA